MKRLFVFSALILLVLSLLTACVPEETRNQEAFTAANNVDTGNLKPAFYLLDGSGNKTYGVYEFPLGGNHCIVIADVFLGQSTDTNSAPSLFCK